MNKPDTLNHSVNWNRAIFINDEINDELVNKLAPTILLLRQENNEPITIGINSPGGSLESLDILIELLTGPTQNGVRGEIVTVATNCAYSAAANFLAFGNYSIALKHSKILYHDVRYSGIRDVTPEKALNAAKSLKEANDAFSLRLANKIIRRLVWIYIDLRSEFEETNKKYPGYFKKYDDAVSSFAPKVDNEHIVDMASFATCLFAKLSRDNDSLISRVMDQLRRWIVLTNLAKKAPSYKLKGSRISGLLDGIRHMHKMLDGAPEKFESLEDNLKLLLTLLTGEIADENSSNRSFQENLDTATRDFILMQSMNDHKHRLSAIRLMIDHDTIFLGKNTRKEFESKSDDERRIILEQALPSAQLFWLFCALLCRELFEGEHILNPSDAQLLGLVDEVAGGGPVESRREFRIKVAKESQKAS